MKIFRTIAPSISSDTPTNSTQPLIQAGSSKKLSLDIPIVLYADEWGGVGGTAGYLLMLARGLRRYGHRVVAICHAASAMLPVRTALEEMGVDVRSLPVDGDVSPIGHWRRHRSLVSLFREHNNAILCLLMGYFTRGGGVTLAAARTNIGAIVRAELTPPEPPVSLRQKLALQLKSRLVERVIVGAAENREAFACGMGLDRSKIAVVHTGIELERFQPDHDRAAIRDEFHYDATALVVGTVSRLDDERKGLRDFLAMSAHIAPVYKNAHFLIVGDGVLRPDLEHQADRLGIRERVTFAGWRQDIPRVLAGIDVFVMPSHFEGGPTSVLEAMAMARPVVATAVGMVPEIITHGSNGLIVQPGQPAALAESVSALLADNSRRTQMGARARQTAERDFSVELMVDRYLQVFAEAIAARRHRRRRLYL